MNKRAWLNCICCLIVGLAIGYFCEEAVTGKHIADYYASLDLLFLGESGNRASHAYQHESSPVAIYALTEFLEMHTKLAQMETNNLSNKKMFSDEMTLIHARLAKLYAETGQTNLSEQHIDEALNWAKEGRMFQGITNKSTLMELVAKFDKIKSQ
jgi:hypothetical protein